MRVAQVSLQVIQVAKMIAVCPFGRDLTTVVCKQAFYFQKEIHYVGIKWEDSSLYQAEPTHSRSEYNVFFLPSIWGDNMQ